MTSARQRASLADQVFDRMEQQILRGDYAPGEVLSENGLSAQLGVSGRRCARRWPDLKARGCCIR
jgi:DNA-binding GntR family transcriptional regulator